MNSTLKYLATVVLCAAATNALAEPVVYLDQGDFLIALTALGYTHVQEGFEDYPAWGKAEEGLLVAIGGWLDTNTPYASIGLFLGVYPNNELILAKHVHRRKAG